MKKLYLFLIAFTSINIGNSQALTWSTDIAPMFYTNCTDCHHAGGLAPFSLMSYSETFAKRYSISMAVSEKTMPPWPPDRNYRQYAHQRYLTDNQILKINSWVSNGAASGDTTLAPAAPVYTNTSVIPNINKVLRMPLFTVPSTINYDLYQCFTIPTGLTQDEFITALEVIPGNPSIVHHVLVYEDITNQSVALDNASPEPGYTSFGGPGFNASLVGGWVPGTVPTIYPTGMGVKLHANSRLVLQIHYPAGSANKIDSTKLNLRLSNGSLREIFITAPLDYDGTMIDGPLAIPANSVRTFHNTYTIPTNVPVQGYSILNVAPHAHLICKNWLVFAKTPTGDTLPLIQINEWDFHWQGFYTFQHLLFMPKGTTLYGVATYDNTSNNPHNPSNPPQAVQAGESTTDEMMLTYFSYLNYQPGDEIFLVDSSLLLNPTSILNPEATNGLVSTAQLYDAMPNPATNQTTLSYYLPDVNLKVELKIFDLQGKLIEEILAPNLAGFNTLTYNTSKLSSGTYLYSLATNGKVKTKQLIITK